MKHFLLKSLLAIAVLCVGSGSVWGDEHILYSQNFESFAADANFTTIPEHWQYAGAAVQKIVESGSNKYLILSEEAICAVSEFKQELGTTPTQGVDGSAALTKERGDWEIW